MARKREFDPEDVLQAAILLFWEKGYCDSSVDELVRTSGVAKYGIYGVFGSKRELFKKALARYAEQRRQDIQAPIRTPGASLPEIQRFFKRAVELMTRDGACPGCLIVNTGVELGSRDEEFAEFVAAFFRDTTTAMARCLARAVDRGELESPLKVSAMASYLVTEFRAALMLARTGASAGEIRKHLEVALSLLG